MTGLLEKKLPISVLIYAGLLLAILTQTGCVSEQDSVSVAKKQTLAENHEVNPSDTKFLVEMADARMMDSKEGQLASERGTREDIRNYGQLMLTDQAQLLAEIQTLAMQEKIVLPRTISQTKADGFADLKKLNGTEFDHKFARMITIDHERDVKQFRIASADSDKFCPTIRDFAMRRLPLIESHLEKIKAIAEEMRFELR